MGFSETAADLLSKFGSDVRDGESFEHMRKTRRTIPLRLRLKFDEMLVDMLTITYPGGDKETNRAVAEIRANIGQAGVYLSRVLASTTN